MLTHAWSQPKANIQINQKTTSFPAKAAILAVSRENGVDHVEIHPKSINKAKFKVFLEDLRSKYRFDDIILVMDNLNFHKSNDV